MFLKAFLAAGNMKSNYIHILHASSSSSCLCKRQVIIKIPASHLSFWHLIFSTTCSCAKPMIPRSQYWLNFDKDINANFFSQMHPADFNITDNIGDFKKKTVGKTPPSFAGQNKYQNAPSSPKWLQKRFVFWQLI